jgi:hypothetical protein
MYGDDTGYKLISLAGLSSYSTASLFPYTTLSKSFWFADSVTYDNDGTHQYSLVDPYQVTSYSNLAGKYTFRNSSADYHNNFVYYIVAADDYYMYYIQLERGQLTPGEEEYYVFGDGFEDNGDGTYTLINPMYIPKREWGTRHTEADQKFTCGTGSTLCSNPRYVLQTEINSYYFISASERITIAKNRNGFTLQDTLTLKLYELLTNPTEYSEYKYTCKSVATTCTSDNLSYISSYSAFRYKYYKNFILGSSVSWNGSEYTLVDTIDIDDGGSDMTTHHFACESLIDATCEKVFYIYDYNTAYSSLDRMNDSTVYYVEFTNGVTTVNQYFDTIFENKYDSHVKSAVDAWFKHTLVDYIDMLEDTQFCNDRTAYKLGSWGPNNSWTGDSIKFAVSGRLSKPTLNCANINDTFTVSTSMGNGKLTYPVGLLSEDEVIMAGHSVGSYPTTSYKPYLTGDSAWTMSPYGHHPYNSYVYYWSTLSEAGYKLVGNSQVRPVISIKPGIYISDGDGTATNPWTLIEY